VARSLFTDRDGLSSLCRRLNIRRLSLFGSVLPGADRPESDVDLLVEFRRGAKPSLLDLADIEQDLSGCSVAGGWICASPRI
jgi:uncharacterized protein